MTPRAPRRLFYRARVAALCLAATACGASGGRGTKLVVPTYLFGTLGNRSVDLMDVCGGRPVGAVSVYPTPGTVGLGILTLGTYLPLEVRVQCSEAVPFHRVKRRIRR